MYGKWAENGCFSAVFQPKKRVGDKHAVGYYAHLLLTY